MDRRHLPRIAAFVLLGAVGLVPIAAGRAAPPEPESSTPETRSEHEHTWSEWSRNRRPSIGLQYGFGDISRKDFGGDFGPVGQLDLRVGYVRERRLHGEEDLVTHSTYGLVVTRFASSLSASDLGQNEVGLDTWKIGFGSTSGGGYRLGGGNVRLLLLTGGTGGWYVTDLQGQAAHRLAAPDSAILARYDDSTRFGDSYESVVRLCLARPLAVQVGYERTIVLPGFKTWYWLLSNAIDMVALAITDEFVDEVGDASPHASPIVAFLLRSGIQYGFYELRQSKMNWPFETEAPLAFDTFKMGLGVAF